MRKASNECRLLLVLAVAAGVSQPISEGAGAAEPRTSGKRSQPRQQPAMRVLATMEKLMDIMSKLLQHRLRNARKPAGRFGRLLIRAMNISHYRLADWGLNHLSIGKQDTILDVGCGGGGTINKLARIAPNGKIYGIDLSNESVVVSRMTNKRFVQMGHVEILQSSVSGLPFLDSMFDLVTAVNTHNYWPDLVTDMQEVLRVLKPGGRLTIIGGVYAGGKHDRRNQKYAALARIALPSLNELREAFLRAGYSEVQMFEERIRSWICGIGRKPS
jgi:ubiquinone/menaquinone biosynthesis C-methylase UbiE